MTLVGQGRFAEAERQFNGLIRLYPEFTNARISLAHMLMQTGRLDEAVIALDDQALIRADPRPDCCSPTAMRISA